MLFFIYMFFQCWCGLEDLKLVNNNPKLTALILECSEKLTCNLHETLYMIEGIKIQNIKILDMLTMKVFQQFNNKFGQFFTMSPSPHRVLQHSKQLMTKIRG